jgi:tRNA threonylcarbamoyladenosine biosynthesis protein TsaE
MYQITTKSVAETETLGFKLGETLEAGDVVCLRGGLGTGKTALTGGIAGALGISGYITSPTFTIVNEYTGKPPLYHFDVYRISDPEEMFEIGFEEYLDGRGVVVIEWAELIKDILPPENIEVVFEKTDPGNPDERRLTINFNGEKYRQYEGRLKSSI